MWPGINLNFMNSPQWQQWIAAITGGAIPGQQGNPTYTASGQIYNGPFANDNRIPFRTVEGAGQYGAGLNASAGQMYDHYHRKVALDRQNGNPAASVADYGLKPAGRAQSLEDFANRGRLMIPEVPADPTIPGPNPNTNTSGAFQGGGMVPSIFRIRR